MKNTILWSALFTLIGTQVYADPGQAITPPPIAPAPQVNATVNIPSPIPAANQNPQPIAVAPIINCDYKIPAQTKKIDQTIILTWSERAVTQAFSFSPALIDDQMQKLQTCFTQQGWTGFSTALQKSGNIEAIKSQKLNVTSQVDGQALITEAKENQWKLTLPIVVVYQNEKEKVSQLLSVDLTVGRKPTGDLGITQMIATPRGTVTTKKPQLISNPENTSLDTHPGDTAAPAQPPLGKPQ